MTDLLTELRNDFRMERTADLWKKHGKWVIYAAVSVVLITAMMVYSKHHREQAAMEATGQYFDATRAMLAGNHDEALSMLDAIEVAESSEFYSLVLLKKSQALALAGKQEQADAAAAELAKRADAFGDVGRLMSLKGLDDKAATPLANSRKEWQAWELATSGNTDEAAKIFAALAADEKLVAGQRERAEMMAHYLGKP